MTGELLHKILLIETNYDNKDMRHNTNNNSVFQTYLHNLDIDVNEKSQHLEEMQQFLIFHSSSIYT